MIDHHSSQTIVKYKDKASGSVRRIVHLRRKGETSTLTLPNAFAQASASRLICGFLTISYPPPLLSQRQHSLNIDGTSNSDFTLRHELKSPMKAQTADRENPGPYSSWNFLPHLVWSVTFEFTSNWIPAELHDYTVHRLQSSPSP